MAHKQEYPPLLPQGFHHFSIQQLKDLCVAGFPLSESRADIMAAFEVIYEHALGIRINGEFWIDGSFLTRKIEPGDVDLILVTPARFYDDGTQEQQKFLDWLINTEDDPRKSFRCHTDIVLAYDPDHAEYGRYRDIANHWQNNVYGYSVTTREPKGIVVVSLTGDEAV